MDKHNKYSQTMKEKVKKDLWKWAAIIALSVIWGIKSTITTICKRREE